MPLTMRPSGLASSGYKLHNEPHQIQLPYRSLGSRRQHVMDHVAGVENLMVAIATYEAACRHWPGETITLRQGARVIEDSRKEGAA
jgi:hypothetical protein